MAKKTVAAKKRNVKVDANGQLHVHSSFNNIIVSLANSEGQIIAWLRVLETDVSLQSELYMELELKLLKLLT